ncbi:MAG: GAF domain-containing sensor histidine kinase [Deltaproteobacteria bacterium]|nr:GAF domain-containing sensor histidine kinase [Deltaproteobacteria bacterium]
MAVAKLSGVPNGIGLTGYSALSALADLLTIAQNSARIYDSALDKVLEVLNLRYGNIRVLDPATGQLELLSHRGFPDEYAEKYRSIKIGERSSGKIVRTRGPVLWDNIQTDSSCAYLSLRKEGINSLLGVPLLAREGVVGTLAVASPERGGFGEQEIQLLAAMGRVIGITIENARLFTALKNNVDDLTKLTLRLEESGGIKERLLSVISHELRTPVTVILGNVEILMDGIFGEMNEKQRDSLQTVRRSGAGLLFQVENAIEVSQLEAGGVAVHPDPFTVDHIRDVITDTVGDEATHKKLELHWEIDSKLPPLFSDQGKLTKVFRNLIDNAIKFTEKGSVNVRVRYSPERRIAQCEIEDTGIGISADRYNVIFDPFHQIDSSHTRLYGGMGLGLRNVKKILELLGGGIEVDSVEGKGSIFKFWFPVECKRRE